MFLFILIIFSSCISTKIEEKPLWADFNTINKIYPQNEYVVGLAYADSEEIAFVLADANLASYFSKKITSFTKANQIISYQNQNEAVINRDVKIETQIDLQGIRHTECWFNKKNKKYYVCAYLNRKEYFDFYEIQIINQREKFNSAYNSALSEKSPIKKIEFFNQAKKEGVEYLKILDFAETLYKEGTAKYIEDKKLIFFIDDKILQTKNNISFNVDSTNNQSYKKIIENIISENGYLLVNKNYSYSIQIKINENKTEFRDTIVSNPEIEIEIKDKNEIILLYQKSIDRITSYIDAESYLDLKINNSIKNILLNDFSEYFSKKF